MASPRSAPGTVPTQSIWPPMRLNIALQMLVSALHSMHVEMSLRQEHCAPFAPPRDVATHFGRRGLG